MKKRSLVKGAVAAALLLLASSPLGVSGTVAEAAAQRTPSFTLDHNWPKPLPNNWQIGPLTGLATDRHDIIWTANQSNRLNAYDLALQAGIADCCRAAPTIMAFDRAGNLVKSWNVTAVRGTPRDACGPFKCFDGVHTIYVDQKDNVWIVGNGKGDSHIVKFDYNGKFLLQIGGSDAPGCCGNQDTQNLNNGNLGGGTGIAYWPATNEVFVSDGYINRRVIVFDADTGQFKRMWGAYGKQPPTSVLNEKTGTMETPTPVQTATGPGAPEFSTVHGIGITPDGTVWVADRVGRRIQQFTIDGKFLREHFVKRNTSVPTGVVYSFSFSPDMRHVYIADGGNKKIHILDRETFRELGQIGGCGGQMDGCFNHVHVTTTDKDGNVYTGEAAAGARFQRWNIRR